MSSRSFRSVFMVASCAGAALGCYLVSLRVASERAQLEDVENRIVLAQRDMRVIQTEIGTRGRLSQLERWNAGAFALSAPAADQFLKGSFELAKLAQPERKPDFKAPVYLASAPALPQRHAIGSQETDDSGVPAVTPGASNVTAPSTGEPSSLLHIASFKTETREVPARTTVLLPRTAANPMDKPATAARPASHKSLAKPDLAAAHHQENAHSGENATVASRAKRGPSPHSAVNQSPKKSVDKAKVVTARAMTKTVRLAKVDPLAPLPAKHSGHSKDVTSD